MKTTYIYNRNELLLDLCREAVTADDFVITLTKNLINSGADVNHFRESCSRDALDMLLDGILAPIHNAKSNPTQILEVVNELLDKGAKVRETQIYRFKQALGNNQKDEFKPIYDALKKVYDARNKACYGI